MSLPPASASAREQLIADTLQKHWGFTGLRELQREAIDASLDGRDSLVVLPTGGGKSLCYQVPPLIAERTDVVVSPLISLMKDQVDGLRANGYPAVALHSGLSPQERNESMRDLNAGKVRLIFAAPERLMLPGFLDQLSRLDIRSFAIDEAHCISHWGHDFRPEYRQLATLRERFPAASLHAYTATATPRVREDIVQQLNLQDPLVLVGTFDRPNLVYRIVPQGDTYQQIVEAVERHKGEAVIVYCISRKDTEALAAHLKSLGIKASHYHAGMDADDRRKAHDLFSNEDIDVVVATVAFGMGIDRSDVRCVVHAAMPKSVEAYQQETGRAGRDGLEAECMLLYSAGDVIRWENLIQKSSEGAEDPSFQQSVQLGLLREMRKVCSSMTCRHKSLSRYFGQEFDKPNCGACDVCLGDVEGVEDATVIAQKILSCVARTDQRFGIGHVVDVLLGANTENIRRFGHEQLSVYGLIKDMTKKELTAMTYQLVDQDLLTRTTDEYPTLRLNSRSMLVLKGKQDVKFQRVKKKSLAKQGAADDSWEGVDKGLFEHLRELRRAIASERGVPPYVIFHDRTLRDLARVRPTKTNLMGAIYGMGTRRIDEHGDKLAEAIADYCRANNLSTDEIGAASRSSASISKQGARPSRSNAYYDLFSRGSTVEEIAAELKRSPSTVMQYLAEYVEDNPEVDLGPWVDSKTQQRVIDALSVSPEGRLKPIYEHLEGQVPYELIRLVLSKVKGRGRM